MKKYEEDKKKAQEADHRHIGKKQNLFFFHDLSPGLISIYIYICCLYIFI